jgi:hypothetical protein
MYMRQNPQFIMSKTMRQNPQFIMSKTKQQNNDIIVILHLAVNMRPLTMRKSSYFIFSKNEKLNYLQTVKIDSSTQTWQF